VFSSPSGNGFNPNPGTGTPESPLAVALPAVAILLIGGGYLVLRRRKTVTTV
jgi:hypothetical protein